MAVIEKKNIGFAAAVGKVLGTNDYRISNLCTHRNINHNAKFKPVPYSNPFPDRNSQWWKGNDKRCGCLLPDTVEMIFTQESDSVWEHDAPKGGSSEPYRIADFGGYDSNAASDWGVITIPTRVVQDSTTLIGLNMLTPNQSSLTYAEVLAPEYTEDRQGLYLALYRQGGTAVVKRADYPAETGKMTITITEADMLSIGGSPGNKIYIHFFGRTKDAVKSLRNAVSTKTLWEATLFSSEPFVASLQGEFLHKQDSFEYGLYNLGFILNAQYYAGGTLEAGNSVQVFREVAGTELTQYHSLYSPLWNSGSLPEVTVQSGEMKNALNTASTIKIDDYGDTINSVVIILYDSKWGIIESRRVVTKTVTSL